MVKVNAPALSLDASGTIAKSMVFSKWKGRAYVRSHVMPAQPRTGAQVGVRAMMKFLAQYWVSMSANDKATWLTLAKQLNVSEFNAFTSLNMKRWRNFLTPSTADPVLNAATAPTAPTATATAGVRQITLVITHGANVANYGYLIHRYQPTGGTPAFSNCVAVIAAGAGGDTTYVDTPLKAGQWFYKITGFMKDGKVGATSNEYNANVA